jgi:hypothetical protein
MVGPAKEGAAGDHRPARNAQTFNLLDRNHFVTPAMSGAEMIDKSGGEQVI